MQNSADKNAIFYILQNAFDHQVINGMLEPEKDSGKEWKDKEFYKLLVLEVDADIVGSFINDDDEEIDYRVSFIGNRTAGTNNGFNVDVVCVSDNGFYFQEFSNTEIACIVNYFNLKLKNKKLCFNNKEED